MDLGRGFNYHRLQNFKVFMTTIICKSCANTGWWLDKPCSCPIGEKICKVCLETGLNENERCTCDAGQRVQSRTTPKSVDELLCNRCTNTGLVQETECTCLTGKLIRRNSKVIVACTVCKAENIKLYRAVHTNSVVCASHMSPVVEYVPAIPSRYEHTWLAPSCVGSHTKRHWDSLPDVKVDIAEKYSKSVMVMALCFLAKSRLESNKCTLCYGTGKIDDKSEYSTPTVCWKCRFDSPITQADIEKHVEEVCDLFEKS